MTAAWITAAFAVLLGLTNIVVSYVTRRSDHRNRTAERAEDVAFHRRDAADAQRRATYAEFVLAAEELAERFRQGISPGAIAQYRTLRDGPSEILAHQEAETGELTGEQRHLFFESLHLQAEAVNPLPEIIGTPQEKVLTDLLAHARATRGMVEIVGPPAVAAAAIRYEEKLWGIGQLFIKRDIDVGPAFADVSVTRTQFIQAAVDALDPERPYQAVSSASAA